MKKSDLNARAEKYAQNQIEDLRGCLRSQIARTRIDHGEALTYLMGELPIRITIQDLQTFKVGIIDSIDSFNALYEAVLNDLIAQEGGDDNRTLMSGTHALSPTELDYTTLWVVTDEQFSSHDAKYFTTREQAVKYFLKRTESWFYKALRFI
jgi:hypothetical protein